MQHLSILRQLSINNLHVTCWQTFVVEIFTENLKHPFKKLSEITHPTHLLKLLES